MKKTLGILGLLIVVFLATAYMADSFLTPFNLENLIRRTSLFGIISIHSCCECLSKLITFGWAERLCVIYNVQCMKYCYVKNEGECEK